MSQHDRFQGGGAEYGAPADAQAWPQDPRPSMRPAPQYAPPTAAVPQVAPSYADAAPLATTPPQGGAAAAHGDSVTVALSRAYRAHDVSVRQVTFRKPTTADLRRCGYPMRNVLGRDGRVNAIDELPDVVGNYINLLSDPPLPPSTVNELSLEDFSKCSEAVLGFFIG